MRNAQHFLSNLKKNLVANLMMKLARMLCQFMCEKLRHNFDTPVEATVVFL